MGFFLNENLPDGFSVFHLRAFVGWSLALKVPFLSL